MGEVSVGRSKSVTLEFGKTGGNSDSGIGASPVTLGKATESSDWPVSACVAGETTSACSSAAVPWVTSCEVPHDSAVAVDALVRRRRRDPAQAAMIAI